MGTELPTKNLHQIHLRYLAEEDRILLLMNFYGGAEAGVWLTRRLCRLLWPKMNETVTQHICKLQALQGSSASSVVLADQDARQLLADLKRDRVAEQMDFSAPYVHQDSGKPPGHDAMLVSTVHMRSTPEQGLLIVELVESDNAPGASRSLTLNLDEATLHAVMAMLEKTLQGTDWGMQEEMQSPLALPSPSSSCAKSTEEALLRNLERPKFLN